MCQISEFLIQHSVRKRFAIVTTDLCVIHIESTVCCERDARHIRIVTKKKVMQYTKVFGMDSVIGIKKCHHTSLCARKPRIPCERQPAVLLMNHSYALIRGSVFITYQRGAIRGAVIHKNQFPAGISLRQYAFNALTQIFFHAVNRHYYADQIRHHTVRISFSFSAKSASIFFMYLS